MAVFGQEPIDAIFGINLFDDPDLEKNWNELLGLSKHNAFECVGEIWETRLAFYRCVKRGCRGLAITKFCETFLSPESKIDWEDIADRYNAVYKDHLIPATIYERVKDLF